MNLAVPGVVARYFEADRRRDPDAVIALFTDDTVVTDEGRTRRGAADLKWRFTLADDRIRQLEIAP
ncbi:nuclear transport factor 2 family protein [Nonomuraea sp. CA-143628]|uniref:nuclear transport factor 2 family protein n=1 Tax=Nonomuraea sp. CA-143628 TaxID=3239997 RepID=UPI003D929503